MRNKFQISLILIGILCLLFSNTVNAYTENGNLYTGEYGFNFINGTNVLVNSSYKRNFVIYAEPQSVIVNDTLFTIYINFVLTTKQICVSWQNISDNLSIVDCVTINNVGTGTIELIDIYGYMNNYAICYMVFINSTLSRTELHLRAFRLNSDNSVNWTNDLLGNYTLLNHDKNYFSDSLCATFATVQTSQKLVLCYEHLVADGLSITNSLDYIWFYLNPSSFNLSVNTEEIYGFNLEFMLQDLKVLTPNPNSNKGCMILKRAGHVYILDWYSFFIWLICPESYYAVNNYQQYAFFGNVTYNYYDVSVYDDYCIGIVDYTEYANTPFFVSVNRVAVVILNVSLYDGGDASCIESVFNWSKKNYDGNSTDCVFREEFELTILEDGLFCLIAPDYDTYTFKHLNLWNIYKNNFLNVYNNYYDEYIFGEYYPSFDLNIFNESCISVTFYTLDIKTSPQYYMNVTTEIICFNELDTIDFLTMGLLEFDSSQLFFLVLLSLWLLILFKYIDKKEKILSLIQFLLSLPLITIVSVLSFIQGEMYAFIVVPSILGLSVYYLLDGYFGKGDKD